MACNSHVCAVHKKHFLTYYMYSSTILGSVCEFKIITNLFQIVYNY